MKHVINSDNDNNHYFYFNENEEIEDLVFSMSSVQYNPRLSHFLACMARSAYTKDLVSYNYEELGFDKPKQLHYDEGDLFAANTLGKKTLDDGRLFVFISVRGTNDGNEWTSTNFNFDLKATELSSSIGVHTGFENCKTMLYASLKEYLGGTIPKQNVTYVITGHSLGGAVGNLLAMRLYNDGVSNQDVYDYNFACPLVAAGSEDISIWNDNGVHNNIINIGNWCDWVTHRPVLDNPYYSYDDVNIYKEKGWTNFKRFGVSYWFDNGWQFVISHDMGVYIDYIEKEYDETHFRDKEFDDCVIKSVSANCPVDVVIYDKNGNPIAGTINDKPNYYGYECGEKAFIFISGDRKLFYILNNEYFEVRLIGTDEGEMEYSVSDIYFASGDVVNEKRFESVLLTDGKKMLAKTVNVLDEDTKTITQDEKLLLADQNTEILENGEETGYTVKYILGDSDNSGKIDMVDATSVQRKLAGILTPFADDVLLQGDANGNSELEITDVTAIQSYLAEISIPYLIGADVV